MEEIKQAVRDVCKNLFKVDIEPELTRPDEQFGDYATNIALQLAKKLDKNPREVAETIVKELKHPNILKTEVAEPGFINITLTDEALWQLTQAGPNQTLAGKTIVVEYSDPNPFKELHVGHLFDSVLGEAIAKLNETAGAKVYRVNFGGDVGLHVAKAMWSILRKLGEEHGEYHELKDIPTEKRAEWLAEEYVIGSLAYGDDERIDNEIKELNKKIYEIHETGDKDSDLADKYWTCREWSYDYFKKFYKRIGTKFDKYYPESTTVETGLKVVKEQLAKRIFKESNGAVIFDGEIHSLHTRVFINSEGLPTYETKDIGLALNKWQDYHFDQNIILSGNDIVEYMKVVLAALSQFEPEIAKRTTHLTHGMVKLQGGTKMSSREGNVIRAVEILDMAAKANKSINKVKDDAISQGAVKYAFLKQRREADIVYNPEESVSLQGNSGPYLQYAHARARSILRKSKVENAKNLQFDAGERSLARKIGEYPEVVDKAVQELMPHHVCTYLYELAQTFNSFYESNRVIGDPRENIRRQLVESYAGTLKKGLSLLNISAPEKM